MKNINLNLYNYLFLDRDGVINIERPGDYVKKVSEFIFIDGALDALAVLSRKFRHIFIVTNQRGVGRNAMNLDDLMEVHKFMTEQILHAGGNISKIYFCTDTETTNINRKPNTGMGFKALDEFPDVNFARSIMVGNSLSDIEFGKKLGMFTILVGNKYAANDKIYGMVDAYCKNLFMFASSLV